MHRRKKLIGLCFALIAVVLFLTGLVKLQPDSNFIWDPVTVDIDGNPETVVRYELAVTATTVTDLNAGGVIIKQASSITSPMHHSVLTNGLPKGQYHFFVRAVDDHENVSVWSPPFVASSDRTPPEYPRNFGLSTP
jgi:hypothetical protein